MVKTEQRGIALVSVLGAIAVITVLTTSMVYRHAVDLNVQTYALQKSNALITLLSLENVAQALLVKKVTGGQSRYDYYNEAWAEPVEGLLLGGANVTFMIFDAQSKFNVNNANAASSRDRRIALQMLRAYMKGHGRAYREVYNWVSLGNAPSNLDSAYLRQTDQFDSYRVGRTSMVSLQELRLLRGIREKETRDADIAALDDYLSFLPMQRQFVKVNVNTANTDLIKKSLGYFRSANRFKRLMKGKPYTSINRFCSSMRSRRSDCRRVFDIKSSYYYVHARIQQGNVIVLTRSLMKKKGNKAFVMAREMKSF